MNLKFSSVLRILGLVMAVIGVSMLPSFIVSLIYDSSEVYIPFLMTSAATVAVGVVLLKLCSRTSLNLRVRDGFLIVSLCWLLTSVIGAVPFITTGSIPDPADAFFESCSGFSTTGASILQDIEALPRGILFWRSFTHWIGGMGILIFAIALMPSLGISGQNIVSSETPGPSLDKVSPKMSDTARTLCTIYFIFTIAETVLLMFGGMSLYDALIHTFGTVGTGGFSSYNDSIAHFDSVYIKVVITGFMALCGINFNLFFFSMKRRGHTIFEDYEFRFYLCIMLLAASFIFCVLLFTGKYANAEDAAVDSAFQTVSILTTTGYATADYETWPVVCQTVLLLLMFIGGCSSSTSGGLKCIRILVVMKLIRRGIATRLHPNVVENVKFNGQTMPGDVVSAIANHIFLYIVLIFLGAFLVSFENEDVITSFSSVITCLGNIGPGFGSIGPSENFSCFNAFSKTLLSIYMIAGRLELYTLFILFTPGFWSRNQ